MKTDKEKLEEYKKGVEDLKKLIEQTEKDVITFKGDRKILHGRNMLQLALALFPKD